MFPGAHNWKLESPAKGDVNTGIFAKTISKREHGICSGELDFVVVRKIRLLFDSVSLLLGPNPLLSRFSHKK